MTSHQDWRAPKEFDLNELELKQPVKAQADLQLTDLVDREEPKAKTKKRKRSRSLWLWLGFIGVLGASLYELAHYLLSLFESDIIAAVIFSTLFVLFSAGFVGFCRREWQGKRHVDILQESHAREGILDQEESYGQAQNFISEISSHLKIEDKALLTKFERTLSDTHNDREVLKLFADSVLVAYDQKAQDIIIRYSSQAGLLVAISPLAILDLMMIFWRSLRMVNELADLYGCPRGILSRGKIFRLLLQNLVFTGASELLADAGADLLGGKAAAKVSGQVAQGLGVAVLSVRLGVNAVKICRPLKKPSPVPLKLSGMRKQVLGQIKHEVASVFTKRAETTQSAEKVPNQFDTEKTHK